MRAMLDHLSDEELLAISVQTPEAFARFYRRYDDAVLAFFAARTKQPEVAADLTSETFAAALVAAPKFDPTRAPASAWLFGIARHKLTDSYRRGRVENSARRRLGIEPIPLEDADIERVLELEVIAREPKALSTLLRLPDRQRDAVIARILDESSYPAIAKNLKCSEDVARQRVSRGLRTLRHHLKGTS